MGVKFNFNNIEKAFYETAKNIKLENLKCPKCKNSLWKYSFKELNKIWKIYCTKCEQDVYINMDKVPRELK